jgi:hypothetical protein
MDELSELVGSDGEARRSRNALREKDWKGIRKVISPYYGAV